MAIEGYLAGPMALFGYCTGVVPTAAVLSLNISRGKGPSPLQCCMGALPPWPAVVFVPGPSMIVEVTPPPGRAIREQTAVIVYVLSRTNKSLEVSTRCFRRQKQRAAPALQPGLSS